jgi:uncharacterized protein
LPYYTAEIGFEEIDDVIRYELSREEEPPAEFSASFNVGKKLPPSKLGSKEFFLTERYVLYTESEGELYHARIHHQPWPLQASEVQGYSSLCLKRMASLRQTPSR